MSSNCLNEICEKNKRLISRVNRVEGQIRGIKKMIEKEEHCDDILNQITSIKAALDGVAKVILEAHLRECVVTGIKNNDEIKVIDELIYTLGKMIR